MKYPPHVPRNPWAALPAKNYIRECCELRVKRWAAENQVDERRYKYKARAVHRQMMAVLGYHKYGCEAMLDIDRYLLKQYALIDKLFHHPTRRFSGRQLAKVFADRQPVKHQQMAEFMLHVMHPCTCNMQVFRWQQVIKPGKSRDEELLHDATETLEGIRKAFKKGPGKL